MKKITMLMALTALLVAPVFAGAPDAASQVATPNVAEAPAQDAQVDIGTWLAAGTDQGMQEAIAQTGVEQAAGCTAQTSCSQGTISCSGNTCFTEPHCFVYCDTTGMIRCNNPCP